MNALIRCLVGLFLTGSCLTSLAEDRCIQLEGQSNFRDVGGYQTRNGKSVKRGIVFRSGRMPLLTEDDVAKLERMGIKAVVNFLTPEEVQASGKNRLPRGAVETLHSIDSDGGLAVLLIEARTTGDFSKMPPDINPEIHRMVVNEARKQYAALFREIYVRTRPSFTTARTASIARGPRLRSCCGHLAFPGKPCEGTTYYLTRVAKRKSIGVWNTFVAWLLRTRTSRRRKLT